MDLERFIRSKLDQFKSTVSQRLGNVGGAINQGVQNFNKPIQKTTPINWNNNAVGQGVGQFYSGLTSNLSQDRAPKNEINLPIVGGLYKAGQTFQSMAPGIQFAPIAGTKALNTLAKVPKFVSNWGAEGNAFGQVSKGAEVLAKTAGAPAPVVSAAGFVAPFAVGSPKGIVSGLQKGKNFLTSIAKGAMHPEDMREAVGAIDRILYGVGNDLKPTVVNAGKNQQKYVLTQLKKDEELIRGMAENYGIKMGKKANIKAVAQELYNRVNVDSGRPQMNALVGKDTSLGVGSLKLKKPYITPGAKVRANDRGNIGTVWSIDEKSGTAKVRFTNRKEGTTATVERPLSTLTLLTNQTGRTPNLKMPSSNPIVAKKRGLVTSVGEAPTIASGVKAKVHGTYIPKPNEKLMGEAKALLNDGASIDFKNTQGLDKKVAATIQEAINLQKQGNHEAAANLYNNLSEHATELGRGVQAFSLLDKMSPEAVSLTVAGRIRRYNSTHSAKIPELTGEQTKIIADKVAALDGLVNGSREKNIALNEINKTINSFIPSSITEKAIAVWKAGLLTSLRTHERNFLGNLIHGTAEVAKDPFAVMVDKVMSLKTGERTKTFTLQGLGEFGSKNTRQQMIDIVKKGYDPSQQVDKFDYRAVNWGNNAVEQTLKKYTDLVFNTLGASDKPFWNAAMARSLYDQAGAAAINAGKKGDKAFIESIVKNPPEEILKRAVADANVATFKNKNVATSVASAVKRALANEKNGELAAQAGNLVGEVIMPFTGVPSSILGQAAAYSPIGLTRGIINAGRVLVSDVPNLQREAAHEIGRGVVGTGVFGLGAYLAGKGLITGQPKDAAEARQWELENKPRNSIFINGQWKSLNSVGPESIVLLAGAKFNEDMNNPEKGFGGFAGDVGKDVLDQSFLTGIQQPVNAITDPARYGKSYAGNLLSSPIPNIVKDLGKSLDPYQREANTITDYAKSNIPLVRNTMLPRRDALGNPIPQEPTGVNAFIDPFNTKTPVNNPVVNELSRLNSVGANATPGKIANTQTIGGIKTKLTPEQLDTFESSVGSQAMVALAELFKTEKYQSMTDEEKSSAVDSLMAKIRKQIREGAQTSTEGVSTKKTAPKVSTKSKKPKTLKAKKVGKVKVSKIKAAKAPKIKFSKVKAPKFKIYKPTKGKFAYSK